MLGVAAIIVLSVEGHPLMGVFGFLGLGLGAYNNRLLQKSVLRYASAPDAAMSKKQFRRGVMGRLGLITLLAIARRYPRPARTASACSSGWPSSRS